MSPTSETQVRQQLVQVALGRAAADLVVRDVRILDVFTLSWLEHHDIVVAGQRIAWTGPTDSWAGTALRTLEGGHRRVVPGFGEAHKHIESSHLSPEWEAELSLRTGTTWVVEASHEYSNVDGPGNTAFWLRARREGSPFKIFVAPGSATPPTAYEETGGYYGYPEIRAAMDEAWVPGLDEVMDWSALTQPTNPGYERIWANLQATWDGRGVIQGHGAGLTALGDIAAFAAAGLAADHECRDGADAWNKLSRGIFLHVRPRSAAEIFGHLVRQGLRDWSNLSVTTDDRGADVALRWGTMDHNIRAAIKAGVPVEAAYAMGSYYPARHWHLEHLVGSVAPGRYADLVFVDDDLAQVKATAVVSDGRAVAEAGRSTYAVPRIEWPAQSLHTMRVARPLQAEDFGVHAPPGRTEMKAALLRPFYFLPEFPFATLPVRDGLVQRDPAAEISKVAVIDRHHASGSIGRLFWQGLGPRDEDCAIACSVAHDHHQLWTLGSSDAAMALAANDCCASEGGWSFVRGGVVAARIRLEVGGLMTCRPAEELAAEMAAFDEALAAVSWYGAPEYVGPNTAAIAKAHGDRHLVKAMIFAWLTCTPWHWVLLPPGPRNPTGLVNVTDGRTHPIVW
jgi:adenine deaminase